MMDLSSTGGRTLDSDSRRTTRPGRPSESAPRSVTTSSTRLPLRPGGPGGHLQLKCSAINMALFETYLLFRPVSPRPAGSLDTLGLKTVPRVYNIHKRHCQTLMGAGRPAAMFDFTREMTRSSPP